MTNKEIADKIRNSIETNPDKWEFTYKSGNLCTYLIIATNEEAGVKVTVSFEGSGTYCYINDTISTSDEGRLGDFIEKYYLDLERRMALEKINWSKL